MQISDCILAASWPACALTVWARVNATFASSALLCALCGALLALSNLLLRGVGAPCCVLNSVIFCSNSFLVASIAGTSMFRQTAADSFLTQMHRQRARPNFDLFVLDRFHTKIAVVPPLVVVVETCDVLLVFGCVRPKSVLWS